MDELAPWLGDRAEGDARVQHCWREPARSAKYGDLFLHDRVETALDARGIDRLYRHQADAIQALRDGQHVVVATPTASGKSLVYTVPAVEASLQTGGRSLYVAPTRALINDQESSLIAFVGELGFGPRVTVAKYTGQLNRTEKRKVREEQPHLLLTTPDMLHLGILPHAHRLWDWFFESLSYVVVDEIHEYRGVFGSHVALVLRRLARIAERFNATPQYVCCSATIGNPVKHATAVTGQPGGSFVLVDEDTSGTGPRQWVFWNPPLTRALMTNGGSSDGPPPEPTTRGYRRSPHPETATLLADLVQRDYQTLVFTRARQTAERYAERTASLLAQRGVPDHARVIGAYQAALTDSRRDELEGRLKNGSLRGVWSTNALELGIDIGSLDAVLLDGYPGTRMETHQRAGRAGRGTEPSLVALVAGRNQLDQYLMANPEVFFDEPPERAIVNPENEELLPNHVCCAARENWLSTDDEAVFGDRFPTVVSELEERGELDRQITRYGTRWTYSGGGNPQLETDLRTVDPREIRLIDLARDDTIARLPFADALRDAHPGAIYYHQGRTYEVVDLDVDHGRALLRETDATYYTRAIQEKDITIERELADQVMAAQSDLQVTLAAATISQRIEGYVRFHSADDTGERMECPFPLPETSMRTETLCFTVPADVEAAVGVDGREAFLGALHAIEHGMISLFPLELLCDRRDIGGLSTNVHPQVGRNVIFIHDGHPGGVGLARGGFEVIGSLLDQTREMIDACPCEYGCPACVQSPHCGNANTALEKELAVAVLDELRSG